MKVFFYNHTNFGDHMNSWLWPRLIPDLLERDDDIRLVGIGSLLNANLASLTGRVVILGAGAGYGPPPSAEIVRNWKAYAVRGPLTARQYGLDPRLTITDGAWLINQLPEFAEPPEKGDRIVFVPHFTSAAYGNWRPVAEMAGLDYIDPREEGYSVIDRIGRARLAIVESLHGAVFADYLRTPWIPVASRGRVLVFKWLDWCMSVDLPFEPLPLPPSDFIDFITQGQVPRHKLPQLSARKYDAESFFARPVAASGAAGALYLAKKRTRLRLGRMRKDMLDWMCRRRDLPSLGGWNRRYREMLAGYMAAVAEQSPFLSSPTLRDRRIEELNAALESLRRDYGVKGCA